MGDILIKGMEVPQTCGICPLLGNSLKDMGFRCVITGKNFHKQGLLKKRKDCPLVEIPPHGRLIDADTLADDFNVQLVITSPYMQRSTADEMVRTVSMASQMAPTVLEASDVV